MPNAENSSAIIRKTKRCEIVKRSVRLHKTKCTFSKFLPPYKRRPEIKESQSVFLTLHEQL